MTLKFLEHKLDQLLQIIPADRRIDPLNHNGRTQDLLIDPDQRISVLLLGIFVPFLLLKAVLYDIDQLGLRVPRCFLCECHVTDFTDFVVQEVFVDVCVCHVDYVEEDQVEDYLLVVLFIGRNECLHRALLTKGLQLLRLVLRLRQLLVDPEERVTRGEIHDPEEDHAVLGVLQVDQHLQPGVIVHLLLGLVVQLGEPLEAAIEAPPGLQPRELAP